MVTETRVPVLIVGGGIVGLAASLFLSQHGIESMVVERHSGTSVHPRARSVNARTMELFRHLDIDERVRQAGASISTSKGMLAGPSLKEVIEAKPRSNHVRKFPFEGLLASISPASGTFVTQDMLEPVLLDTARARGVDVRFSTECLGVAQDPAASASVTAMLQDRTSGTKSTVRAAYTVAADGAKSPLRAQLGIPTTGRGSMGHLLNILFDADLGELVRGREFSLCRISRPEVAGLLTSIDNATRWVFHLSYAPARGESPDDFPAARCTQLLRLALGLPDDAALTIQSIMPWEPAVRVAARLRAGRVFLAGDAAHQMPPWGGQGANSGVADAHNLAWKIAAVLRGRAGDALLETYDAERRPVGAAAAEASAAGADDSGLIPIGKWSPEVVGGIAKKIPLVSGHGYGYQSRAVCGEATWPLGGLSWRPWSLPSLGLAIDGRPGRRVPHVWVEHRGNRISTLDLSGTGFALLAGADGAAWLDAAKKVSSALGVGVAAYRAGPDGDLVAPRGTFEAAAGISSQGALLVRPDDFVALRERRQPSNHEARLDEALRKVLSL